MFKFKVGQYQLDNTSLGQQNILLISFVYIYLDIKLRN